MKKTSYKIYFATEENCYEGEKLGVFTDMDEVRKTLISNIYDDCYKTSADVLDILKDVNSFTDTAIKDGLVAFMNVQGYDVIYIVTTDGRKARKQIAEMRKECIAINF